jgi:HK97 gp10 family phage protein
MAEDFEVTVEGLAELGDELNRMPYKFAQNIQRAALQAAGEVIAAEIEARAPVAPQASHPESEPGDLRDSVVVTVRLGKDLDTSVAHVGPGYDKAKYGGEKHTQSPGVYDKFVEYGTAKMAPEPFMRPAFQAGKEKALEAYTKVVSSLIGLLKKDAA